MLEMYGTYKMHFVCFTSNRSSLVLKACFIKASS